MYTLTRTFMPSCRRFLEEKRKIDQNRNHFKLIMKELRKITAHLLGPLRLNHNIPKITNDSLKIVNKLFFASDEEVAPSKQVLVKKLTAFRQNHRQT